MYDAAINICVQVFVWTYVFISFGCVPRSRIVESDDNYEALSDYFPKQLLHSAFPPALHEGSDFSTSLPTFII